MSKVTFIIRFTAGVFLLMAILSSCEERKSDLVLPKERMANLLKELHLAESYVNANYVYSDSSKYIYKRMEDSILKAQGVAPEAFDSSLAYYNRNVQQLDEVYAMTVDSLSIMEGRKK